MRNVGQGKAIRKNKRERGIALMVTTAAMFIILPVVGLAIDAGFLYAVRAKLTAAADAAALAAARSLSKGLTLSEQEYAAQQRARAFFDANFPDGFLMTSGKALEVNVAQTALRTRTVQVTASVDAGLFFMRTLGRDTSTVRATGTASRRDVNLMLVLDRSGSMDNSNSCEPMKAAARQFIDNFANGRDRIGMITFGMTYYLAFPPSQNFKPSLDTTISQIDCAGGTGTAQALSEGYQQIKNINEPGALNILVFFTDGLPNGITAAFPVKDSYDTRYGYGTDPYRTTSVEYDNMPPSTCQDSQGHTYDRNPFTGQTYSFPNVNPLWAPGTKTGVMAGQGSATADTGWTFGLTKTTANSLTDHNAVPIEDSAGCQFADSWTRVKRDVAYIPDRDVYDNDMSGYLSLDRFGSGPYQGEIRPDTPLNIGRVSKNAADNAARTMRQDAAFTTLIYTIGLGDPAGGDPPDPGFMKRVANDPSSPSFSETEPAGLYVFAPNKAELTKAFSRVASEVLRITH